MYKPSASQYALSIIGFIKSSLGSLARLSTLS